MSNAIISTLGKLAIGAAGGPVTKRIDFANFQTGVTETIVDGNRNRGKLDRHVSRTRIVREEIVPRFSMPCPTAYELDLVLKWICGGTPATVGQVTTYPFSDTNTEERALAYFDNAASGSVTHTYTNNAVRSATFSSSESDPMLSLNLSLIGREYDTITAFPSLSAPYDQVDITTSPFVHTDTSGAVVINSVATPTQSISLEIDNNIPDRYLNSLYQTANFKVDRTYRLSLAFPLGEAPTLYTAGPAGVPVTITYTNGNTSLVFTMPLVQFPRQPIEVPLRGEIYHVLQGTLYESSDGTTPPLKIQLDSTALS